MVYWLDLVVDLNIKKVVVQKGRQGLGSPRVNKSIERRLLLTLLSGRKSRRDCQIP